MGTTGADRLCEALAGLGVGVAFGLPGSQNLQLYEALRASRVRTVLATHELAAAFMAHGYHRASGLTAAVVTIPGPGFTYALTGLAEALHDSIPLLLVVGACAPGTDGRRWSQALDQRAIAAPLVKGAFRLEASAEVGEQVAAALALARGGEPGPVLREWTAAALEGAAPGGALPARSPADRAPAGLAEAVRVLAAAERPLLVVGQGCAAAAPRLVALAEALRAPVLTTSSGRGVLPEDHALAMGFELVRGGSAGAATELAARADCVVALGCKLGFAGTGGYALRLPEDRLIRVDTSAEVIAAGPPARHPVMASAEAFLDLALSPGEPLRPSRWSDEELAGWRARCRAAGHEVEPAVHGARPSTAAAFFAALRRALPREGIVVTDSGLHQVLARRHLDVLAPRGLILPSDYQSMGYGIPAAIGARLAAPGRPVVAIVGDGGFAMSGLELLTAAREGLDLTVVVFADGRLNRIRLEQLAAFGRSSAVDLVNPDFGALAAAVGARHVVCDGDPEAALREALGAPGVKIVEVPVGDTPRIHAMRAQGVVRGAARRALGPRLAMFVRRILRR
jgi:acetolactate synthase-1/2/3 large subunit